MTVGTYELTHEKILNSAKKFFMEYSYDGANLRDLCKEAQVTTGAFYRHFKNKEALFAELVKPALDTFNLVEQDSVCRSELAYKEDNLQSIWTFSQEVYQNYMKLFYQNFSEMKLLLCHSNGSKYENFFNELIDTVTDKTIEFTKMVYKSKNIQNLPNKDELHILLTALWRCILEPIMHDFSLEQALSFCATINKLFNWEVLFEF